MRIIELLSAPVKTPGKKVSSVFSKGLSHFVILWKSFKSVIVQCRMGVYQLNKIQDRGLLRTKVERTSQNGSCERTCCFCIWFFSRVANWHVKLI